MVAILRRSGKNYNGSCDTSSHVHVLRTPYSVLGIILVRYIALHILLSGGIKLFDLLCISL
jgi:hypothetical protein